MTIRLTLPGAPRTKKNSQRVLPMISAVGLRELIQALSRATSHGESIKILMTKILMTVQPSEGFQEWFGLLYLQRTFIQSEMIAKGVKPPIMERVSIAAAIYREADRGDATGYYDAIADAIQAELWQCQDCRKKTMVLANCPYCGASIARMRHSRKGLGIIGDDKQIEHWDGTRLLIDRVKPRVELVIRVSAAPQASLFEEKHEEVLV